MTLTIDLTPAEEARLAAAARREGIAPAEAARKLMTEHLPPVESEEDVQNAASIALLQSWLKMPLMTHPRYAERKKSLQSSSAA